MSSLVSLTSTAFNSFSYGAGYFLELPLLIYYTIIKDLLVHNFLLLSHIKDDKFCT